MNWVDVVKQRELVSVDVATQILSTDLMKIQSRIFPDAAITLEDPLFVIYIDTAEKLIESICEITLRQKTYKLNLACWPSYDDWLWLRYEFPPIISLTHIKYYDSTDTQQTLSSSLYENWLSHNPPQTAIKSSNVPTLSPERTKNVEIQLVAGYSTVEAIPAIAKLLILELVAFWFQNREALGKLPSPVDGACYQSTQAIIDSLRWRIYP